MSKEEDKELVSRLLKASNEIHKKRLLKLVSDEKTDTINRNKQRIKWRWFIRLKNKIKLFYLTLINK